MTGERVSRWRRVDGHLGGRAGGQRCCLAVHRGYGVHPTDEQREPLPGHGIGPHEVRGRVVIQGVGGFTYAFPREVVAVAGGQMGCAVADPPGGTVLQQAGQGAVNGRQRLAQEQGQFVHVDEG